ncbi:MAG: hypothetical protein MUF49_20445 [Oculatellaceae cyanobacterium Prado106]|nr:hypothetical protein [Oculatellaceae cyanobacterium Prado106]
MAFPDRFHLWSNVKTDQNQDKPAYSLDALSILQPYFDRSGVTADQISRESLELIVASWLSEIMHSEKLPAHIATTQPWLIESGLYEALAGGKLEQVQREQPRQACFLNRNSKDLDIPDIVAELRQLNCRMIPRFDRGYNYIRSQLLA